MTATSDVHIRRIRPEDGLLLRELRLRAIVDAPEAFGQPLEEARQRPDREWHKKARQASRGDDRTWLIAEADGRAVGLVQGRQRRPRVLLLFSMWVDPGARRLGVGRKLIERLENWARGWGGEETVLWVLAGNRSAITFYRDLGFEVIRAGQDAESGARFAALAMRRSIGSPTIADQRPTR